MPYDVAWKDSSFATHSHTGGWNGLVFDRQVMAFVDGLESCRVADINTAQDAGELLIVEE